MKEHDIMYDFIFLMFIIYLFFRLLMSHET